MKKQYISPDVIIVMLDGCDTICTSNLNVYNADPQSDDKDDGYYRDAIF